MKGNMTSYIVSENFFNYITQTDGTIPLVMHETVCTTA